MLRPLRNLAKRVALLIAPSPTRRLLQQRAEVQSSTRDARTARIAEAIESAVGSRIVAAGPFRGLKYTVGHSGSQALPKLAGTYEAEIAEFIERAIKRGPKQIVNIGCGEGYYAVGLALRIPGAIVHAFDTDPEAQRACVATARNNDVLERVIVGGTCTRETLTSLATPGALVVCDCEGCETALFSADVVRQLRSVDCIIELHDFVKRTTTPELITRFAGTHDTRIVDTRPRDPDRHPALSAVAPEDRAMATDEGRPGPMAWLVCTPRYIP